MRAVELQRIPSQITATLAAEIRKSVYLAPLRLNPCPASDPGIRRRSSTSVPASTGPRGRQKRALVPTDKLCVSLRFTGQYAPHHCRAGFHSLSPLATHVTTLAERLSACKRVLGSAALHENVRNLGKKLQGNPSAEQHLIDSVAESASPIGFTRLR